MHYLSINHLLPGMVLAKPIMGDNGSVLLNVGNKLTETTLGRMKEMDFQGAYIDTPMFSEIEVDDIIDDDLRYKAFNALKEQKIDNAVQFAKEIVRQIKFKETLKLDLLDIKSDNNYVFKHSISVAAFSAVIGIGFGMNEEQLENLTIAGLLHDLGKLEIKRQVLYSKNKYNKGDMDEMKKHPLIAFEALKDYANVSSVSRNAILFHHENLDGSGYYQVPAEQIGIFPRILRVVDTYDSLTTLKQYRQAYTPGDAMEYLMSNVDTLFDKSVVEIFLNTFPMYPVGYTIRLSNKELAVVSSNEKNSMRPLVKLFNGKTVDLSQDSDYRSIMIEEIM